MNPPDVLLSIYDHDLVIRFPDGRVIEVLVWDCDPIPYDVSAWLAVLGRKEADGVS